MLGKLTTHFVNVASKVWPIPSLAEIEASAEIEALAELAEGVASWFSFWHPEKINTNTPIQKRINCNFFIIFFLNGYN
jgi:hypothetical protein